MVDWVGSVMVVGLVFGLQVYLLDGALVGVVVC